MEKHIKYDIVKGILSGIDDLYYRGYVTAEERSKMLNSIPHDLYQNYLICQEFDN